MSFITTYGGEVLLLQYMLNAATPDNVKLHLYTNNYSPTQSDTLANYTESSSAGYSPIVLIGSNFTIATAAGTTSAIYARQTFSFSSSDTIYGYYITNNPTTSLIFSEQFLGSPFSIPSGGGTIGLDPNIQLGQC